MLSLSVAEQVHFRNKKGNVVTALPVTVEFGKLIKGDRNTRNSSFREWKKQLNSAQASEQVASPTDLLHAVVALYHTCQPGFSPQSVYSTVCGEGSRTLLLLRNSTEILREWENQIANPEHRLRDQQSTSLGGWYSTDSSCVIKSTTILLKQYQDQEQDNLRRNLSPWRQHPRESDCSLKDETLPSEDFKDPPQHVNTLNKQNQQLTDPGETLANEHHREQTNNEPLLNKISGETNDLSNVDALVEQKYNGTNNSDVTDSNSCQQVTESVDERDAQQMTTRDSTSDREHLYVDTSITLSLLSDSTNHVDQSTPMMTKGTESSHEEWLPWVPKKRNEEDEASRKMSHVSSRNSSKYPLGLCDNVKPDLETSTESPFSDIFSDSGEISTSDSDMEEEEDGDDLSRGLEAFLKAVAARRKERMISVEMGFLLPTQVGMEHKLIASVTFQKNYRIPGAKIVYLSFLAVRKKFRKRGLGSFLLQKLKNPSLVGPYDALVVRSENSTLQFFRKNGFTDDIILNSKFRDVDEGWENSTLISYLPPFDGHYPPFPGTKEWNRPEAVVAMQEEMNTWRLKSLEAYQAQVTCLTRLQQEVLRLHALLRKQEAVVQFLKNENQKLQSKLQKVERRSTRALVESLEKEAADFEKLCTFQLRQKSNS
ncbi:uncharacterized protein LOC106459192 [Limulus polyphemus]|uniref:Uncharacterized protein LOC106459192 n=1 Tax=Limulus polyphemus TaxID=6850 RepID=A0ABM1SCH5_LIMPO|nr:uncharacterized protein LOC106459192 [Limulus polyphemus]